MREQNLEGNLSPTPASAKIWLCDLKPVIFPLWVSELKWAGPFPWSLQPVFHCSVANRMAEHSEGWLRGNRSYLLCSGVRGCWMHPALSPHPAFACRKTLRCPVENPASLIPWGRAQDEHKVEGLEFLPKASVPQGLKGRSAQQCLSAFTWQPRQWVFSGTAMPAPGDLCWLPTAPGITYRLLRMAEKACLYAPSMCLSNSFALSPCLNIELCGLKSRGTWIQIPSRLVAGFMTSGKLPHITTPCSPHP